MVFAAMGLFSCKAAGLHQCYGPAKVFLRVLRPGVVAALLFFILLPPIAKKQRVRIKYIVKLQGGWPPELQLFSPPQNKSSLQEGYIFSGGSRGIVYQNPPRFLAGSLKKPVFSIIFCRKSTIDFFTPLHYTVAKENSPHY